MGFLEPGPDALRFNSQAMRRQGGRVSFVGLLAVVGAVIIGALLLFTKEGPAVNGGRFMDALARGDVQKLTELTYLGKKAPDAIRSDWELTTRIGKHYIFRWRIVDAKESGPTTGALRVMVERNLLSGGSYEEAFGLPMVKENGKWLVDVAGINREMYPALPRVSVDLN